MLERIIGVTIIIGVVAIIIVGQGQRRAAAEASAARVAASLRSNAADAAKLLEHDEAGFIALNDSARHRLGQIIKRAQ